MFDGAYSSPDGDAGLETQKISALACVLLIFL
jgi:hypothetical protein